MSDPLGADLPGAEPPPHRRPAASRVPRPGPGLVIWLVAVVFAAGFAAGFLLGRLG